ncbi:DNA-protecting protein DprA [Actinoallomurus rhizosphaericola]|uniref:DNA-protecting protein DprA n=1 Tax=Actinoallomurus rhizosphaericola TaxID=2952536 RepID=UPI0020927454|nr:DNA-protecting protein DprA [Actinoallomurus rhizosphaericola]MCO5996041.1 DNA-protecting protein DprA [Actinoallomurus rhizosphaericola]
MDMPTAITITGTRATEDRPHGEYDAIFAEYLAPFADEATHFYIGGAIGIDSLTLLWLTTRTRSRITVAVPDTAVDQPSEARQAIATAQDKGRLSELIELRHSGHPSAEAYHYRNRWMVDRSEFVIAFPRGADRTRGTWYTADYAAGQGKPRLIVPI